MIEKLKQKIYSTLKWSEKYTKTDMVYLAKGGFWIALGHFLSMITGIVLTIAFANLLPKETYGTYQFIISTTATIGMITLSKINTAITKSVSQGKEGALRYGFKKRIKWSIGVWITILIVSIYYFLNQNLILGTSFLIAGTLTPFLDGFHLYSSYLIGKERFKDNALLGFWRRIIPFIAMLLTLFLTKNVIIIILIYFISQTVSTGIIYLITLKKYNPPLENSPELISYSKHLSFIGILTMIGNNIDKLFIFHFLGAAPVAIYTLAQVPIIHMQSAFSLSRQMTLPKISRGKFSELQSTLPSKVAFFTLVILSLILIYILTAPYIFEIVFPLYLESVIFSQALALSIISVPRALYLQAFIANEMKKELYISQLSLPIANIILLSILVPIYGLWGVVIATLTSHVITNIIIKILFTRCTKQN